MVTNRKAPESVCRELAEAADDWYERKLDAEPAQGWCAEAKRLFYAIKAYRAATAPLRTRAEVDAEIATIVRHAHGSGVVHVHTSNVDVTARVEQLCDEPTADGPEALDALFGVAPDLPLEDPEPCGCEEGDALKRELRGCRASLTSRTNELREIQTEVDLWRSGKKGVSFAMNAIGLILRGE